MNYFVSFSARTARSALRIVALVLPVLSLFTADAALGQTTVWVADGVGNWNVAANWSSGVPNTNTDVQINNGGTARLFDPNGGGDAVYLGFNSGNTGTLEVLGGTAQFQFAIVGLYGHGTLKIADGGRVSTFTSISTIGDLGGSRGVATVDGPGSMWQSSTNLFIGLDGTGSLSIQNGGAVWNNNGYIGYGPSSNGTATVAGAGSTWTNNGDLALGNAGTGALSITGGGKVSNVNSQVGLQDDSTGTATVNGVGSMWTNSSVLAVGVFGTGALSITGGGQVTSFHGRIGREVGSTGTVVVDGPGSKWTINEQLTIGLSDKGTGTLSVQNGGRVSAAVVTIGPNATVGGDGEIIANVNNTGTVAPGTSPGTLQVTGNYWQFIGGKLQIDLASPTSFDKLAVTGNVTLEPDFGFGLGSGPLEVSLTGGYVPHGSQSFDILDWTGSLSGTFSSVQLPTLGGTLVWDTSQLYTTGVLSVTGPALLAGDYNQNGAVDAADYVVWRKGLGTTYTPEHYDIWRAHFGEVAGGGSGADANAAIPEPATTVLIVVGIPVLLSQAWPRRTTATPI